MIINECQEDGIIADGRAELKQEQKRIQQSQSLAEEKIKIKMLEGTGENDDASFMEVDSC